MSFFDCRNMTMKAVDECPFCHSHNIKKNGREHNHQRWYCKECHRSFSSRTGTILNSSKLRPVQIRRMVSMLSDGVLFHQVAHQIGVSVQTVCLWKRKLQALVKSQEKSVLSGKVYVDHTYINVPAKERSKEKKRGLSKNLRQIAVAIDNSGKTLAVLGGKGNASNGDSEAAFASHVSPNSIVIHDEGHFGRAFSDSTEMAVNSKGKESHATLNPVDRVCNSVQRLFKVHLRIHPRNIQKYLDELVYKAEIYDDKAYSNYMHHIDISIFSSRISFRRRDIRGIQQH